jgi:hypothetical protein
VADFFEYTFYRAFVTAFASLRLMGGVLFLLGALVWCQPPFSGAWFLGPPAVGCGLWWLWECLQYFNGVCEAQAWDLWRQERRRIARERRRIARDKADQALFDAMQHYGQ